MSWFEDLFINEAKPALERHSGSGSGDDVARRIADRTITEYIDNEVTKIGRRAFSYCLGLKKVNCPNVTYIDGDAFYWCTGLSEINFPKATKIDTAFYNAPITTVSLPELIDGNWSFNSGVLTEVYIPKVQKLPNSAFSGCRSLVNLTTGTITSMGENCFNACSSLKSDTLDFSNVPSMGQAVFRGCTSLEELNFPLLSGHLYMSLFDGCTSLRKITFGTAESPRGYRIERGSVFKNCSSLETLIFHVSGVPSLTVTDAFSGSAIQSGTGYIYVPKSLVDSFKSATNWSTYADQIRAIEDYPEICGEVTA